MKDAKLGKFTFAVDKNSNKKQVKQAIEEYFNVDVIKINLMKFKGKIKKVGKYKRKISKGLDWKKAIVKIKEGQKIDLFEVEGK